mmetsp:Transcript_42034/g.71868  ORF Transcript_42034/g.71868 Transcript_42034/m.71868 type:complete len:158 (-) Transcript_42034:111-584(-)|eukprot:CAMPEP_0183750810 /NCGR_PEP_ID=MMETSP0739-20130205/1338_1 /TAXON_ID=385413 /ORGANISM="Thalassiosira miniscula, Strain CCMP1093" /LENGTH=157 /DNA_ID=CAMNT_0025986937 /DNA_START=100 /DNA_END=573 /DNA_ORIENTATION=+
MDSSTALSVIKILLHPECTEDNSAKTTLKYQSGEEKVEMSDLMCNGESIETVKGEEPARRRMTSSTASLSDESQVSNFKLLESDSESLESISHQKAEDPFFYFSSDKRRLEHLLGKELPHLTHEEPVKRKKRISFELDPLHDLSLTYPELFDGTSEE